MIYFFLLPAETSGKSRGDLFCSSSFTARKQRLQFSGFFSSLLSFLRWETSACGKIAAVQQEASCKFIDLEEPGSKITVHVPLWGAFLIVRRVCLVSHNLCKELFKKEFLPFQSPPENCFILTYTNWNLKPNSTL